MILAGCFTAHVYWKGEVRDTIMKVCLVINSVYTLFGIGALLMLSIQHA